MCIRDRPWYNRTGWLGVKHQLTYLLTPVLTPAVEHFLLVFWVIPPYSNAMYDQPFPKVQLLKSDKLAARINTSPYKYVHIYCYSRTNKYIYVHIGCYSRTSTYMWTLAVTVGQTLYVHTECYSSTNKYIIYMCTVDVTLGQTSTYTCAHLMS